MKPKLVYIPVFISLVSFLSCSTKRHDISLTKDDYILVQQDITPLVEYNKPCPEDMVEVKGDFCPEVKQVCKRWLDTDTRPTANGGIGPMRCAEFSESTCLSKKRVPMHFCINRYESQNKEGEFPVVSMSWYEAKASCEGIGKRLCTADEWLFACEGPNVKPYPYGDGMHRDATVCNIDKSPMPPDTPRSQWKDHYKGVASGSMPNCVTWSGVYDSVGNVDEWVNNVGGSYEHAPFISGLKGGYWSVVRNRCRPMTNVHSPLHSYYQNGFRCCKDIK